PAVYAPGASHEVGGPEIHQLIAFILGRARDCAVFVERPGIEQSLDSLAHREFAAVVLTFDILWPAHPFCDFYPAANLIYLWFPRHCFRTSEASRFDADDVWFLGEGHPVSLIVDGFPAQSQTHIAHGMGAVPKFGERPVSS